VNDPNTVSEEQLLYASILSNGVNAGLAVLLLTFTLYITGVVEPAVPIEAVSTYWTLDVDTYLETINAEYVHQDHRLTGWWWLFALRHGDFYSFLGIAFLAGVTPICFIGIIPTLLRKRDWIYATIAVTEVVILVLAASGLLAVGH
jgi:hypothetical protein